MSAPVVTTEALELGFDTRAVARTIIKEGRRLKKPVPTLLDLITAITKIAVEDTIHGSSSLTISITDPNQVIMRSGMLDPNDDGKLDRINLNYPDGSDYWWSLSSIAVSNRQALDMIFMEKVAVDLLQFRGPLKANRGTMTRAEFVKSLIVRTKQPIDFHSSDLHKEQPIEITPPVDPGKTAKGAKKKTATTKAKDPGIPGGLFPRLKYSDGSEHTLTKAEVANASKVMKTAVGLCATDTPTPDEKRAIMALLEACIIESPFFSNPLKVTDHTSVGILQLLDGWLGGSTSTSGGRRDIALVSKMFLENGFAGQGGAFALAKANPTMTSGEIAWRVQGCAEQFRDRYGKVEDSASLIYVSFAAGSLSSNGVAAKTKSNFNFQVGNSSNPRETYWDAIQRLADEVKWAFFVDGEDVYFSPETSLIRQQPVAVISAFDPGVIDWSYNWDSRHIFTEMDLVLICDPDAFHAGEVVLLNENFGPAGKASNSGYPGRWLIETVERDLSQWSTTLTLKQPTYPGSEPATQSTDLPDSGVGDKTAVGKVYAAASRIDARNRSYGFGAGHKSWEDAINSPALDCSSSVSLALYGANAGLMPGASGPQTTTYFQSWGDSGQGKHMTLWVKPNGSEAHVWLEFHGFANRRFDTSPHGDGPSGPHLRKSFRNTDGFIARRIPGDV